MTKVNEVVVDALEEIVVQQDEAPITQSEAQAVIRTLNDMMNMWAAKGINLGYTAVTKLNDILTVAPGAILGIKSILAIYMANKYEVPVSADLRQKAKDGWKAILNIAIQTAPVQYPPTLPMGSGNTYPSFSTLTFYPDYEDLILEETGGAIALETETEVE